MAKQSTTHQVFRHCCLGVAFIGLWCAGAQAQAGRVTVVTSMSQEMVQAYQQAFALKHPDIQLEVIAHSTPQLIREVEGNSAGQRPDVVWASSVDAFTWLAGKGLLQAAPEVRNPQVPAQIGRYVLNDAAGRYFAQSLSGYGMMWNTEYLQRRKLPDPKEWRDLALPAYSGHVVLSTPSRSGTAHQMVEGILQAEGWDRGWNLLLQIAGNAGEISADSYGVPRAVIQGQMGVGMVIDAFGFAAKYAGMPVDFAYPATAPILPTNIALVAGSPNAAAAKRFMAFTLTVSGQKLLMESRINRMPVLPLSLLQAPAGYPDAYQLAQRSNMVFDATLSSARYGLVTRLFDQWITEPLADLQAAAQAIHAAEKALRAQPESKNRESGRELLAAARRMAFTPLLQADAARDVKLTTALNAPASAEIQRQQSIWQEQARNNYRRAQQLAVQAKALAKP